MKEITEEKLANAFAVTEKAIATVRISAPENSHLHKAAQDYLEMAQSYVSDAKHFQKKGDYINAFGSVYYAHGWLDAGARLGLFDVGHDSTLFTVD